MTKSKTLVDMLEAQKVQPPQDMLCCNDTYNAGLDTAIEIASTHQDTEVQRLRDVIGRCKNVLGILKHDYNNVECDELVIIIEAIAECNAVLEDKK